MGNQCCNEQKVSAQETTMAALEPKAAAAALNREKENSEAELRKPVKTLHVEDQGSFKQKRRRGSLSKPVPQMQEGLKLPPSKKLQLNQSPSCKRGFSIEDQKTPEDRPPSSPPTKLKVPSSKPMQEDSPVPPRPPHSAFKSEKKVAFQVPTHVKLSSDELHEDSDSSESSYEQVLYDHQKLSGEKQTRLTSGGLESRRPTGFKASSIPSKSQLI